MPTANTNTTTLQTESPADSVLVIEPRSGWSSLNLRDIWAYRELLYFLMWRDVKVRYKQTALGVLWAIIQPFFSMVVFTIFFGKLAKIPSDGVPYPVFAFTGLVPWTFFAHGLQSASDSIVGNSNLIKKIYFPRLIIPIAGVLAGLLDFVIAFFVLIGIMLYYNLTPTLNLVWLPAFLLLILVTALGVGLWLSALNVRYRDVKYTLGFMTQLWLLATPIAYPSSLVGEPWHALLGLNPMAGVVEGFRWALLGTANPPGPLLFVSAIVSCCILISGAFYFRRMEATFADVA